MVDKQLIEIGTVVIESSGILIAEKRTAMLLCLATILTVIIFFMTK